MDQSVEAELKAWVSKNSQIVTLVGIDLENFQANLAAGPVGNPSQYPFLIIFSNVWEAMFISSSEPELENFVERLNAFVGRRESVSLTDILKEVELALTQKWLEQPLSESDVGISAYEQEIRDWIKENPATFLKLDSVNVGACTANLTLGTENLPIEFLCGQDWDIIAVASPDPSSELASMLLSINRFITKKRTTKELLTEIDNKYRQTFKKGLTPPSFSGFEFPSASSYTPSNINFPTSNTPFPANTSFPKFPTSFAPAASSYTPSNINFPTSNTPFPTTGFSGDDSFNFEELRQSFQNKINLAAKADGSASSEEEVLRREEDEEVPVPSVDTPAPTTAPLFKPDGTPDLSAPPAPASTTTPSVTPAFPGPAPSLAKRVVRPPPVYERVQATRQDWDNLIFPTLISHLTGEGMAGWQIDEWMRRVSKELQSCTDGNFDPVFQYISHHIFRTNEPPFTIKKFFPKPEVLRRYRNRTEWKVPPNANPEGRRMLESEIEHLIKIDTKKHGFSVSPLNRNLYHWELTLTNFDRNSHFGRELMNYNIALQDDYVPGDHIDPGDVTFEVKFPLNFPIERPLFRLITPRFQTLQEGLFDFNFDDVSSDSDDEPELDFGFLGNRFAGLSIETPTTPTKPDSDKGFQFDPEVIDLVTPTPSPIKTPVDAKKEGAKEEERHPSELPLKTPPKESSTIETPSKDSETPQKSPEEETKPPVSIEAESPQPQSELTPLKKERKISKSIRIPSEETAPTKGPLSFSRQMERGGWKNTRFRHIIKQLREKIASSQSIRIDVDTANAGIPTNGAFWSEFSCVPASKIPGINERDMGGKVYLPDTALQEIMGSFSHGYNEYSFGENGPMTFEISTKSGQRSFCGVYEFSAPPGCIVVPEWMMRNLQLTPGVKVQIRRVTLPPGSFFQLQPHDGSFHRVANVRAMLEWVLRRFVALSVGDTIEVDHLGTPYVFNVLQCKPHRAISITDLDISVDFAPPLHPDPNPPKEVAFSGIGHSMVSKPGAPLTPTKKVPLNVSFGALRVDYEAYSHETDESDSEEDDGKASVLGELTTSREFSICPNCRQRIAEGNMNHITVCSRMNSYCEICDTVVKKTEMEKHMDDFHAPIRCHLCSQEMEKRLMDTHINENCPKREVKCTFCELTMEYIKLWTHEQSCGAVTEYCAKCKSRVPRSEMKEHSTSCTGKPFVIQRSNSARNRYQDDLFECEHCKTPCATFEELQVHVLTAHAGDLDKFSMFEGQ